MPHRAGHRPSDPYAVPRIERPTNAFLVATGENPGIAALTEVQQQRPGENDHGLAFRVVILQAESPASIHMDLFARVERCLVPDELISPRIVDMSCHSCRRNSGRWIDSLSDGTGALEHVAADEAGGLLELVDARLVDHAEG
jgi:hypothetical protein